MLWWFSFDRLNIYSPPVHFFSFSNLNYSPQSCYVSAIIFAGLRVVGAQCVFIIAEKFTNCFCFLSHSVAVHLFVDVFCVWRFFNIVAGARGSPAAHKLSESALAQPVISTQWISISAMLVQVSRRSWKASARRRPSRNWASKATSWVTVRALRLDTFPLHGPINGPDISP